MSDFLEQVVAERRADVARAKERAVEPPVPRTARDSTGDRFARSLRVAGRLAVIAEVKRRSPALGTLRADADPASLARAYAAAGASAISVLTEPRHWGGSMDDLVAVRAAVDVPVLRKDVIVDEYQIAEARAAGCDAILLIAEVFGDATLQQLVRRAHGLGLGVLVEAHETAAFRRAVGSGSAVVGVNARDLRRPSEIDPGRVRELGPLAHKDQLLVAESGIGSVEDARSLPPRVDAVLVGTALMRAADPAELIHAIRAIERTVPA